MPLEEESLDVVRAEWQPGTIYASTTRYFEGPISKAERRAILHRLAREPALIDERRTCLVMGYGGHFKSTYKWLGEHPRIQLLWDGSFLPFPLFPLSFLIASHGGLVKVDDPRTARLALRIASHLAMADLLSFSGDLVDAVVRNARRHRWRSLGSVIGDDPTYFFLMIDGDNVCESGLFARCSFGVACPESLKSIATEFVA